MKDEKMKERNDEITNETDEEKKNRERKGKIRNK